VDLKAATGNGGEIEFVLGLKRKLMPRLTRSEEISALGVVTEGARTPSFVASGRANGSIKAELQSK
jgi:hypothetical protein